MKVIGIIPARYNSSRLPGKPLVDILGKPMIQWVYESCTKALDKVLVATDDQRIIDQVTAFGGEAVMTSVNHTNGTSRVQEAYSIYTKEKKIDYDIIINIQGDEPMLVSEQLKELISCFKTSSSIEMATLGFVVEDKVDLEGDSEVFIVTDKNKDALYFSRHVIPFIKDQPRSNWINHFNYIKHIGLYAFIPAALSEFVSYTSSSLEEVENLEQNRWIENARKIRVGITKYKSYSVDTLKDLEAVIEKMKQKI